MDVQRHECILETACSGYGVAIETVVETDDGRFHAGNGEYSSQVYFCPVCGTQAPTAPEPPKN